jgi:uncharacterized protein (TIGR02270 family)
VQNFDDLTIYEEQRDEASFLWMQRSFAVEAPQYRLSDLAQLDESLSACLDAMLVRGGKADPPTEDELADMESADFAVACLQAILDERQPLDAVLRVVQRLPAALETWVQALAWAPVGIVRQALVQRSTGVPSSQQVAWRLALQGAGRAPSLDACRAAMASADRQLRCIGLSVAGDWGATDLLPALAEAPKCVGTREAFLWARATVLLGRSLPGLSQLSSLATRQAPLADEARRLALLALPLDDGHELLTATDGKADDNRRRIIGAGYVGDTRYVPWLLELMSDRAAARIAAEAFVLITGADFNLDQLEAMPPEGFEDGPSDDPDDEDVELPQDIALPWPDVEKAKAWWTDHRDSLEAGCKRLVGRPLTVEACDAVLRTGTQRQRVLAALHRSLLSPGTPVFPTDAPAWRQLSSLGLA